MLDDFSVTLAPSRHQNLVRYDPAIVLDRIPGECGHATIRFVHDQIGCGNVPVAALPARESGVELSVSHATQPQRQRTDSRVKDNILRSAHPLDQRFRPGDA